MKFYSYVISISLISLLFSCQKEMAEPTYPEHFDYTILPLGASRVEGAHPTFESYRYQLWKYLVNDHLTFDFIGTQTDNSTYPKFASRSFDPHHEGHGGWVSQQLLTHLRETLSNSQVPDIVLFSSPGGNDAAQNLSYEQTIFNIRAIIDVLQERNPNVIIILEQFAPVHSDIMTSRLEEYINRLNTDMPWIASEKTSYRSPVLTVDMHTGFTDEMLADKLHYNEAGAIFVASRYFNMITTTLNNPDNPFDFNKGLEFIDYFNSSKSNSFDGTDFSSTPFFWNGTSIFGDGTSSDYPPSF